MIQFSFRARLDLSPCLPEIDLVNQKISSGIVNELVEIECVVKDYVTLWDHGYWHSLHQLLGSSLYTLPGTWKIKKKKRLGQSPTQLLCCKSEEGSSSCCERDTELCLYPIPYLCYGNLRLKLQGERQQTLPTLEHWRKSIVAKGGKHKITLFPWEEGQDYVLGLQLGKGQRKSHTCDPEKACCLRLQLN